VLSGFIFPPERESPPWRSVLATDGSIFVLKLRIGTHAGFEGWVIFESGTGGGEWIGDCDFA
jgi:hypothetical protein